MQQQWSDIVLDAIQDVGHRILLVTPRVLAALTLILLGWFVAALVRRVTVRVLTAANLDVRCARWGLTGVLGRTGHRPPLPGRFAASSLAAVPLPRPANTKKAARAVAKAWTGWPSSSTRRWIVAISMSRKPVPISRK